jgi:hypothetical protein
MQVEVRTAVFFKLGLWGGAYPISFIVTEDLTLDIPTVTKYRWEQCHNGRGKLYTFFNEDKRRTLCSQLLQH